MKLPNFDEFEPLLALRKKMEARSETPFSLVKIDRLHDVNVPNVALDWSAPQEQHAATPLPSIAIAPPPVPAKQPIKPVETVATKKIAPPVSPQPKTAILKPTHKSVGRPTAKARRRPTKTGEMLTWLLALIAFGAALAALFTLITSSKIKELAQKKELILVAPPPAPIIQAKPQAINPPPEQKTNVTAPEPRKSFPNHQKPPAPTDAAIDTPAAEQIDKSTLPQPESTEEGFRASEILPSAPPPAQELPRPPSEYDINTMPFSDALRYSGREWYTKVKKRKKSKEEGL